MMGKLMTVDEAWESLERRLWESSVIRDEESCWEWLGYLNEDGYGKIRTVPQLGLPRMAFVHRVSWMVNFGEIPEGKEVCHNCPAGDNPACINPGHLFIGTHFENIMDMVNKGRCIRAKGEANGKSVLTAEIVREIREDLRLGKKHRDIAKKFGIGKTTVGHVNKGRTWRHVQ